MLTPMRMCASIKGLSPPGLRRASPLSFLSPSASLLLGKGALLDCLCCSPPYWSLSSGRYFNLKFSDLEELWWNFEKYFLKLNHPSLVASWAKIVSIMKLSLCLGLDLPENLTTLLLLCVEFYNQNFLTWSWTIKIRIGKLKKVESST